MTAGGPRSPRDGARVGRNRVAMSLVAAALALAAAAGACSGDIDAGSNRPHGGLPVDERNPIVLTNDGAYDNWQGEYAVLMANGGGPPLAGIVVNASPAWPDLDANVAGWRALVGAARDSGLENVPDPVSSVGPPLVRPASGDIDATVANRSEGARFIIDTARRLSLPYRPLVVVTGGRLTDVADAYLVDPAIVDQVVVVSSLGSVSESGGAMGRPNGEMDPWADTIVAGRFRYIQVSAFYDQLTDVPASRVSELPDHALGRWMASKQQGILAIAEASDQVGVLAVGLPSFVTGVQRVSAGAHIGAGATTGPSLMNDPDGDDRLVVRCRGTEATARLWALLLPPAS